MNVRTDARAGEWAALGVMIAATTQGFDAAVMARDHSVNPRGTYLTAPGILASGVASLGVTGNEGDSLVALRFENGAIFAD